MNSRIFLKSALAAVVLSSISCTEEASPSKKLNSAISRNNIEEVKVLLSKGANIKGDTGAKIQPINCAPANYEMLKLLIDAGADVNHPDPVFGSSLLRYADESDIRILEVLIDAGADINTRHPSRKTTPLMAVADSKRLANVKLLIDKGADVNAQDRDGNSALHIAVKRRRLENVQLLVEAGIDATLKNKKGQTAAEMAIKKRRKDIVSYFKKSGVIAKPKAKLLENLLQLVNHSDHDDSQYSPDGKLFALAAGDVIIYDAQTRAEKVVISQSGLALAVEFSGDSKLLAVLYKVNNSPYIDESYNMRLYEVASAKELASFDLPKYDKNQAHYQQRVRTPEIRINPDNTKLATNFGSKIMVFDLDGKMVWDWQADSQTNPNRQYGGFDATPDWKYFMVNLQRVEYPSKKTLAPIKYDDRSKPLMFAAVISDDGKKAMAAGGSNGAYYKIFDLEKGSLIKESKVDGTARIAANHDLSIIVGEHSIWYPNDDKIVKANPHNSHGQPAVAFNKMSGEISVSGIFYQQDKTERTKRYQPLNEIEGNGQWVPKLPFSYGTTFHFNNSSSKIKMLKGTFRMGYDLSTEKIYEVAKEPGYGMPLVAADKSFSIDNKGTILFADKTELTFLDDEIIKEFRGSDASFSIAQNNIVGGVTREGTVIIYDVPNKKLLHLIKQGEKGHGISAMISPQGKYLEIRDWNSRNEIKIYDVASGKVVFDNILAHPSVRRFSKDELFYIVANQQKLYFINTQTWKVDRVESLADGFIKHIDIAPDNKSILISTSNNKGQLMDFNTGEILSTFVKAGSKELVVFDAKGKETFRTEKIDKVFK